jgi:hypothetical protein
MTPELSSALAHLLDAASGFVVIYTILYVWRFFIGGD